MALQDYYVTVVLFDHLRVQLDLRHDLRQVVVDFDDQELVLLPDLPVFDVERAERVLRLLQFPEEG